MNYIYIFISVALTVYGQIVVKWRAASAGGLPPGIHEKFKYILMMLSDPWILSAFAAAMLSSISWMIAMTKFEVSSAYLFMGIVFVLVFIFGVAIFNESVTFSKVLGLSLIVIGVIVSNKK